ncbi:hypothetical protein [Shimazuella kribbensis]|uniref:hypothetical protein n=1 Tax=Shimazuella kribbensis TaxID=139808 RepID=UPI0012EC0316|nr:hypothetical protein [Shimazuella kribbensis]
MNSAKFFELYFPFDMYPEAHSFMQQLHAELEKCGERMKSDRMEEPNRMKKDAATVQKEIDQLKMIETKPAYKPGISPF